MIFIKKSSLLALTLSISATHIQPTQTHNDNTVALFCWGVIALTTTVLGVNALYRACAWSDEDVINWVDKGLSSLDMKYSQLQSPVALTDIIIFGRQNKTTIGCWGTTDIDRIVINYNSLLPLHNSEIIINNDLSLLIKYRDNIYNYHLTRYPICQDQLRRIEHMQRHLTHLHRAIMGSHVYSEEEKCIHEKLHHLKQEKLAAEYNALQRENNNIQQQKLNEPNVTIITIDT